MATATAAGEGRTKDLGHREEKPKKVRGGAKDLGEPRTGETREWRLTELGRTKVDGTNSEAGSAAGAAERSREFERLGLEICSVAQHFGLRRTHHIHLGFCFFGNLLIYPLKNKN